jgi:hypothetical protein
MKIFKKLFSGNNIKNEIRIKAVGYIIGAFGLVAALAWNDAIKSLINHLFPLDKDSVPAKFIYAIIITIIVVAATIFLVRFSEKDENK